MTRMDAEMLTITVLVVLTIVFFICLVEEFGFARGFIISYITLLFHDAIKGMGKHD